MNSFIAYMMSFLGLSWGLYRIFNIAGDIVKSKEKKKLANWLLNLEAKESSLVNPFIELFDTVFTKKHFSIKCFLISTIFSVSIFAITFLIYYIVSNPLIADFDLAGIDILKDILPFIIIFTLIPDYFSLLETRYILSKISNEEKIIKKIFWVVMDIILTFVIIRLALLIGTTIGKHYWYDFYAFEFLENWYTLEAKDNFEQLDSKKTKYKILFPYGIFIYSAFFTSIWIWLYGIIGFGIRLLNLPSKTLETTKRIFDIKRKPFKVMGFISIIILMIIYIAFGLSYFKT